jgi:arylsulfatase A-like enzyme
MNNPPNILLFLTDDHGAWAAGCYGNSEVRSPVIDRLAAEGTRFANVFTPSPVCSPARACLLTGRTPSQVGLHDYLEEAEPAIGEFDWLANEVTLAQLLQRARYYCGLSGKWHLGRSFETPRGFDWAFGLPGLQGRHIETFTYHKNGQPITLTGNKTRIITDMAMEFLDQAPTDRSFFLNVGYIATHSPYDNQEPELVQSYADATFRDIPDTVEHPWRKNEGFPSTGEVPRSEKERRFRNYYAAVTDIDRNVGRIVEQLKQTGRLDNTLVIYTSDHGLALGHHGFWGKGNSTRPLNMYDTSLRVPLVMRWPGQIPAGRVIDRCVDHYDTFKTLCDIVGVQLDKSRNYPGASYRSMLTGQSQQWNDVKFGEYGDLRMVRTPKRKLVRRYPDGPDDLFNLESDPQETSNLAADPAYAQIRAQLLASINAFYAKYSEDEKSGLNVKRLRLQNPYEAWRDGKREAQGLQVY